MVVRERTEDGVDHGLGGSDVAGEEGEHGLDEVG